MKSTILLLAFASCIAAGDADSPFLNTLHHLNTIRSTVPADGDVNPYGVAVVPTTTGALVANNILVSNFNNAGNKQGKGTTIVQVSPEGAVKVFAKLDAASLPGPCPGGVGLTTALVALHSGFVVVGSLPTRDGTAATAEAGCLIVLNSSGKAVGTISGHGINGPWDMTAIDMGTGAVLFVSNVLNGTVSAGGSVVSRGSVLRLVLTMPINGMPFAASFTTIASGFPERTDPAALVIGPTGLSFGADGSLFVADTLSNRIAAIPNPIFRTTDALAGITVSQRGSLNQPLGLAIAPNGNILTVNAGDGLIVETTEGGVQVATRPVDVSHSGNGAGTLFGLAAVPTGVYLVNDGNNTLNVLQ